ncbi:hypothetical protein [Pseudoclavibacter helvolus]|uniref:hypothetical protein n=1 Tax=Pseudoclavibacter helvolus TaxID=255205 RepID=UPI00373687EF
MTETMKTGASRRDAMRTGAWSVPVIAVAIATPAASASSSRGETVCMGSAGTYTVTADALTIRFARVPDIYEANVRTASGTRGYGTNYGTGPKRGSRVWVIPLASRPEWAQVHPFNEHYGESTCPAEGVSRG